MPGVPPGGRRVCPSSPTVEPPPATVSYPEPKRSRIHLHMGTRALRTYCADWEQGQAGIYQMTEPNRGRYSTAMSHTLRSVHHACQRCEAREGSTQRGNSGDEGTGTHCLRHSITSVPNHRRNSTWGIWTRDSDSVRGAAERSNRPLDTRAGSRALAREAPRRASARRP
jgi:hypothetical protein